MTRMYRNYIMLLLYLVAEPRDIVAKFWYALHISEEIYLMSMNFSNNGGVYINLDMGDIS